ncbi:MAG TPA: superoxide dismutase [bacterium]|nr:superoxide dismutase [bacterium]
MKATLPELPYPYTALEPVIDARTVELHYSKHHQAYVDGYNAALDKLAAARASGDFSSVKHLKRELAFHGSGHALHSIYWRSMTPNPVPLADGRLKSAIEASFGNFETFEREFKTACTIVEASGWGILAVAPDGRLEIYTIEKHQDLVEIGFVPILACDVWEHSYYLSYQNRRADYVE